jgi:hypothetical protein
MNAERRWVIPSTPREEYTANTPCQNEVGSTVLVRLYDGREVQAKITAIVDSVTGRKVHITYGLIALKIDPKQIIREV